MVEVAESVVGMTTLVHVQDLRAGMYVRTDEGGFMRPIHGVLCKPTEGVCDLCTYMALRAHPQQPLVCEGKFALLEDLAPPVRQRCESLYTIVVDSDRDVGVFVDGQVVWTPGRPSLKRVTVKCGDMRFRR